MKRVFTLFFLFITCYLYPQDTIWCNRNPPPMFIPKATSLENVFAGKVVGLKVLTQPKDSTKRTASYCCRCSRTITGDNIPLLIMDGIPTEIHALCSINPNEIESVEILKYAAATAIYGCKASNGVIIITTKHSKLRRFIIRDFLDGGRIAGATVSFVSETDQSDRIQLVANDSGVVFTDKLNRSSRYRMIVSAVGHKTTEELFENKYFTATKEILLAREIKTCPEVVVTCIDCVKKIRCGYWIKVTGDREVIEAKQQNESFIVFPNPISKGGALNIRFKRTDNEKKTIRIISSDGRVLSAMPINTDNARGNFQIQTDYRWPAGIYFVQLVYENGSVAAIERIVVQ